MQRIEYSKGSIQLIKECFWTGVGTGDIEDSLYEQYKEMKSGLKSEFMFHAHNQYFAILITFGIFGFIWFLFALIYPPMKLARFNDYFFLTFFLIFVLSMFSDDTLETQAGVTLSAFFYSFLLFGKKRENQ
jgi:O-antigen ligase